MEPNRWHAAATYVTGAHNMKAGYQGVFHWNKTSPHATTPTSNTGSTTACRTSSRRIWQAVRQADSRVRYDAFYAQDQWTRGKLTLQGALRYDHAWSYYPAQQIGPTHFLPEAAGLPGDHRA